MTMYGIKIKETIVKVFLSEDSAFIWLKDTKLENVGKIIEVNVQEMGEN